MKRDFFKTICPADADIFHSRTRQSTNLPTHLTRHKSTVQGINIDISFFSPVTVRILKSPDGWKYTKESLSVIGQPEKVKLSVSSKGGILTIKSHQLTVHLNEETGQITFASSDGKSLLQEQNKGARFDDFNDAGTKPSAFINRSP